MGVRRVVFLYLLSFFFVGFNLWGVVGPFCRFAVIMFGSMCVCDLCGSLLLSGEGELCVGWFVLAL